MLRASRWVRSGGAAGRPPASDAVRARSEAVSTAVKAAHLRPVRGPVERR